MSIKIAILKSGEHVIADIKELIDQDEKVVSLVFSNPYVVKLITSQILYEQNAVEESEHRVSFYPWIALSKDKTMPVDPSWIVTIVEPQDMVKSSYESRMGPDDQNSIDEELSTDEVEPQEENIIENFEVITEEKNG